MSNVFHYVRRVEFADTDAAGIAHFTKLIQYMESAEHAFLRSLGLSVMPNATRAGHSEVKATTPTDLHTHAAEFDGRTISWPRVKVQADFQGAAYFEDELTIAVSIAKLGRSSLQYFFQISRLGDEQTKHPIASGQFTVVCCEVRTGQALKSMEIPQALRTKLESFLEPS